jgi:tetratricopeptide (TPR) repeat protein
VLRIPHRLLPHVGGWQAARRHERCAHLEKAHTPPRRAGRAHEASHHFRDTLRRAQRLARADPGLARVAVRDAGVWLTEPVREPGLEHLKACGLPPKTLHEPQHSLSFVGIGQAHLAYGSDMHLARTCARARAGVVLIAALSGFAPPARAEPPAHGDVAQGAPQKRSAVSEARAARALARLSRALKVHHTDVHAVTAWAAQLMPTDGLHTASPSTAEAAVATRFITLADPFLTRVPALAPHLAEAYARAGDFARAQGLLDQAFRDAEAPAPSQGDTVAASPALAASEPLENATLSVASLAHAGGDALLAEQLLRAGLARTPRSSVLLAGLGLLLVSSGRAAAARPAVHLPLRARG